jgi:hypothetical protein
VNAIVLSGSRGRLGCTQQRQRHAVLTSSVHCDTTMKPPPFASEHNDHARSKVSTFLRQEPNPSIERTA